MLDLETSNVVTILLLIVLINFGFGTMANYKVFQKRKVAMSNGFIPFESLLTFAVKMSTFVLTQTSLMKSLIKRLMGSRFSQTFFGCHFDYLTGTPAFYANLILLNGVLAHRFIQCRVHFRSKPNDSRWNLTIIVGVLLIFACLIDTHFHFYMFDEANKSCNTTFNVIYNRLEAADLSNQTISNYDELISNAETLEKRLPKNILFWVFVLFFGSLVSVLTFPSWSLQLLQSGNQKDTSGVQASEDQVVIEMETFSSSEQVQSTDPCESEARNRMETIRLTWIDNIKKERDCFWIVLFLYAPQSLYEGLYAYYENPTFDNPKTVLVFMLFKTFAVTCTSFVVLLT